MADPLFSTSSVRGLALLDFLDWARHSQDALRGDTQPADAAPGFEPAPRDAAHAFGLLALPPVQRSAVWRPKQVTDLWDSLFRGLPIGSFFLIARTETGTSVRAFASDDRITTVTREGFDLFDGQQRTRAMLLGVCGPALDGRCLWVDLAPGKRSRIHMTSRSQPFGYDAATGQKLSRRDRIEARAKLEDAIGEIRVPDGRGGTRPAYDHELFDHLLAADASEGQLPRPAKASPDATHRLDTLLAVWRAAHERGKSGLDALARQVAMPDAASPALAELDAAFVRVARAEVALVRIDPHGFAGGREQEHESLLMLFDRIGAGGTPLSNDERLFSIFKHHDPRVHNAVLEIHAAVGRVMTPTKIVVSALRLANALSAPGTTGTPDVATFARIMTGAAKEAPAFKESLAALIPTGAADTAQTASTALLTRAFESVRGLLEYVPADAPSGSPNPNGLPRVALVDLPAELWQVLLFWAVRHLRSGKAPEDLAPARTEITRFALFWRLCVYNEGRASAWSFSVLHERGSDLAFPGADLYRMFVGDVGHERCANRLLPADVMSALMVGTPSPTWRTFQERFVPDGAPRGYEQLGPAWWRGARRMLPWLQRGYVARAFPAYDPLSNRDDDLPYDLDHICPQSDWAADWRLVQGRISDEALRGRMGEGRFELGNAIGNLRIIDATTNRGDGDAAILDKLPFLRDGAGDAEAERQMNAQAINPAHRDLWRAASGENQRWDAARLQAFQEAVERRSAWLYEQFFDTLGYAAWLTAEPAQGEPDRPGCDATPIEVYPPTTRDMPLMPLLSPALRSQPVPDWLDRLDERAMSALVGRPLPLADILRASAYYPAGGFHGFPMKWLGGLVHSFVYADYGVGVEAARTAAQTPGLAGYRVVGSVDVTESQLTPNGWTPSLSDAHRRKIARAMGERLTPEMVQPPFAHWTVFERRAEYGDDHGPRRISLLYIGGDGVATYDALYRGNACAPEVLCLIRPGTGFGFNYTDFTAQDGPMAEVVLGPQARAVPAYLVSDLVGPDGACCWHQHYPHALPHLPNALDIRIWARG